jgi:hypothetical protein
MTSFMSHIAATGGTAGVPPIAAVGGNAGVPAAAAIPPSGYSSEGSGADWAGKEQRLEHGSALDGWSSADDLAALMAGEEPAPATTTATTTAGSSAAQAGAISARRNQAGAAVRRTPALRGRLCVSTAVQTAPALDAEQTLAGHGSRGGHAGADVALSPDSPDSFVLADSPELFDESAAAAEYESVPHQRSSGTQTQPHLLAGPPMQPGAAGRRPASRGSGGTGAGAIGAVSVDGSLADIQAAFGCGARPALQTRLGGRHPFGPTHLYAYRGVVFEVLRNGAIATVTLFQA